MATMSLRECALADAQINYGDGAVKDLKEKLRKRKLHKRKGVKSNIGDPNPSGNSVKARGK
jgi:hypothetical protein